MGHEKSNHELTQIMSQILLLDNNLVSKRKSKSDHNLNFPITYINIPVINDALEN